jgi:hypothetical protein
MNRLLALGLCLAAAACDPVRQVGIAVEPRPAVLTDSARQAAFAVAARVSARHGLAPARSEPGQQCVEKRNFLMCGKPTERGVAFNLMDRFRTSWSPLADSVRRELLAGLREAFGEGAVRECRWREERDTRLSGCAP